MENKETPASNFTPQDNSSTHIDAKQAEMPEKTGVEELKAFLDFWFSDAENGSVVFTDMAPNTEYCKRLDVLKPDEVDAGEILNRLSGKHGYFSVCLHDFDKLQVRIREKPSSRGDKNTVCCVPGLWQDLDILGPNHKEQKLPPSIETAMEIAGKVFPFEPSMIIDTGGGLHCYWKFKEPFEIKSEADRSEIQQLIKSFHGLFQNGFKAQGYKIDNVSDLARILRLPGSLNHKSDPPMPVRKKAESSLKAYNRSELSEFIPKITEINSGDSGIHEVSENGSDLTKGHASVDVKELVCICAFFEHAYKNRKTLPEPLWQSLISNVASIRPGGPGMCHELSRDYPGYSRQETDKKIIDSLNGSGPITCQTIRERGFDCPRNCFVKSPAGLFAQKSKSNIVKISDLNGKPINNLKMPKGYYFGEDGGIYFSAKNNKGQDSFIIGHPIAVTRKFQELQDKTMEVEILFKIGGNEERIIVSRELIASREIVSLARYGVHVNTSNATQLSRFLMSLELANEELMPKNVLLTKQGWFKIGSTEYFIIGKNYIKAGIIKDLDEAQLEEIPFKKKDPDSDVAKVLSGIEIRGSLDEWKRIAIKFNPYPYIKIVVLACIASPLLEKLRVAGFVIHLGYPTSVGKSTGIFIGGSTFGDPDRVYTSWNATKIAIERISGTLNVLPILLDETKAISAKNKPDFIREIVYQHSEGLSKSRGKPNGLQAQQRWRSIMISTGEANLLQTIQDGGGKARVLDLPEMPFGDQNVAIADFIDEVKDVLSNNYGHAMLEVISSVAGNSEKLDSIFARFNEIKARLRKKLPHGIGTRQATMIATILAVGELTNEVLGLSWDLDDVEKAMVQPCLMASCIETEGRRALEFIYDFAVSNRERNSQGSLTNQVALRQSRIGDVNDSMVRIQQTILKKILKEQGFEPDAVLKEWKRENWIDTTNDKDHPYGKQIDIDGHKTWAVVINSKAIELLMAEHVSAQPKENTAREPEPWELFDKNDPLVTAQCLFSNEKVPF